MPLRASKYVDKERLRKTRNAQRLRYYRKTSKYERRAWTCAEDDLVLAHSIPDSLLSEKIARSVAAIQVRRHILKEKP